MTHSLFSFSHSPSSPPSSSCTSRPRLLRVSRNKLSRYRVALGWTPRLIRCTTAYSRCAYRLHYHNIGSLPNRAHPETTYATNPTTCHHVKSSLSPNPSRRAFQVHLRCDRDCYTDYSTRVLTVVTSEIVHPVTESMVIHWYPPSRRVGGERNRQGQRKAR